VSVAGHRPLTAPTNLGRNFGHGWDANEQIESFNPIRDDSTSVPGPIHEDLETPRPRVA